MWERFAELARSTSAWADIHARTSTFSILDILIDRFDTACAARSRESGMLVNVIRVELIEDPIPGDAHSLVWARPGWEWVRP